MSALLNELFAAEAGCTDDERRDMRAFFLGAVAWELHHRGLDDVWRAALDASVEDLEARRRRGST